MANWYVNSVDQTQVVGSTVASQQVDLTITNVDSNGVHSGYNLSATNFKIGGAAESPTNTWTGGNVDTEVAKVVFSDNGIAGDPANTINAKVYLNSFTCPTAAETIFVDIDENTVAPALSKRRVCINAYYTYDTTLGASIAVTDLPFGATGDITETDVQTGSATTPGIKKHSGVVNDSVSTKIAKYTFTAATGYHYSPQNIAMANLNSSGFDYSNNYNVNVGYTYTNNLITSIIAEVFYNPPQNPPLNPDPVADMCDLDHRLIMDFKVYQTTTALTNTIKNVIFAPTATHLAQQFPIRVEGTPSAQYTIRVTQADSTTDSTIAKYYNFSTDLFQHGSAVSGTQTINANGFFNHFIQLPAITGVSQAYHIVIAAVGTTTLQSVVPDALDEAVITQLGFNTLTVTGNTVLGSLLDASDTVTISLPVQKETAKGHPYGKSVGKSVTAEGGNNNTSSTTLTLNEEESDLTDGMILTGLGQGTHGVTITKIQGKTLTLSKAIAVANDTVIGFEKNTPNLKEFDITISPRFPGRTLLSLDYTDPESGIAEGRQPTAADVGGLSSLLQQVNGAISSSTTAVLNSTKGIVPGMFVTGTGISGTVTVSSITNNTVLILSSAQTISDDVYLTFQSNNPAVKVVDIQADVTDGKVSVQGYLRVNELGASAQARIHLDNFIKVVKV